MGIKSIVLVLLVFAVSLIHAGEPAEKDSPALHAEDLYYSTLNHQNLKTWIESLALTPPHKNQIQAYIKGHHLEDAPLPRLHWRFGTPKITVGSGAGAFDVQFGEKSDVSFNGKAMRIDTNADFNEVMGKISQALHDNGHASWLEAVVPRAEALDPKELADQLMGGVFYWSGVDQVFRACTGHEVISASTCHERTNAGMILSDIGTDAKGTMRSFSCDGDKFKSISYQVGSGLVAALSLKYDDAGKVSEMDVSKDGNVICKYPMKDGELTEDTLDTECGGREKSDYGTLHHDLSSGAKPKTLFAISVPLKRLQDCCAKTNCQEAMKSAVEKAAAKRAASAGEAAH